MSEGKAREIDLGDDFGDVVVKANGAAVEISADGSIHRLPAPANDSTATSNAPPQIGDKMQAGHPNAGWIYAGVSKTTHQPLYVAAKDSGVFQWKAAMDLAAREGARVPSRKELDQIHEARHKGTLKGTFNETGPASAYWYWSSFQNGHDTACAQSFSDGYQTSLGKILNSSLRLVR